MDRHYTVPGHGHARRHCLRDVDGHPGKQGDVYKRQGFESFRFSRCIIKLCIWLTIIYITHSFYLESKAGAEESFVMLLATLFFSIVKVFVMTWFCVEHVTSILENLAVIDGKPKDALIKQVGILWVTVTDKFRRKADETEG